MTPRPGPAVLAGVFVLASALAGCSSGSAPATTSTSNPSSAAVAPGTTAQIAITNFMFVPASLSVHPGAKVTVVNRDQVAHTVTSSASGAFGTGTIPPGQSATFTAPSHPGDYAYICSIHQYMSGRLTVS